MPKRDAIARASTEMRLGSMLLARLDRLEEIDRISPGSEFQTDLVIGHTRFALSVTVKERGVKA